MVRYEAIVLDLDGTLVDSTPALTSGLNGVLSQMGRRPLEHETVRRHADEGLRALLRQACHLTGAALDDERLNQQVELFRAEYDAHLLAQTTLHDGVVEALCRLRRADLKLGVLTNKPTGPCLKVLTHFGLSEWLDFVVSGDMGLLRKPDPAGLVLLMERMGSTHTTTLYVGSGRVDVHTARNAGVASALCAPAIELPQLMSMGSDYVFRDLGQLCDMVVQRGGHLHPVSG